MKKYNRTNTFLALSLIAGVSWAARTEIVPDGSSIVTVAFQTPAHESAASAVVIGGIVNVVKLSGEEVLNMPFREDFTVRDLIKRFTVELDSFPRLMMVPESYLNLTQQGENKVLLTSTRLTELTPGEDGIVHLTLVIGKIPPRVTDLTARWDIGAIGEFNEKTFAECLPEILKQIGFPSMGSSYELKEGNTIMHEGVPKVTISNKWKVEKVEGDIRCIYSISPIEKYKTPKSTNDYFRFIVLCTLHFRKEDHAYFGTSDGSKFCFMFFPH